MDHYETLEVSRNASPEVIRAAYKSLMQRLHPDKHPQGQINAGRAAQIVCAYEVLSDADRRAAYDATLGRATAPGTSPADETRPFSGGAEAWVPRRNARADASSPRDRFAGDRALLSRSGRWVVMMAIVAGGVWALGSWSPRKPDPPTELASIRQGFASVDLTEAERRRLLDRKREILDRHPELMATEQAQKAEEMAARTFALLDSPLRVRISGKTPTGPGPVAEVTIERVSLLVGSFDAQRHLAHLANHRERLVSAVSERLAMLDPARLAGPQSAVYLKAAMLDAIVAALGTDPAQTYPSTYHESPGRYGVVALVLPEQFRLVQIASTQE